MPGRVSFGVATLHLLGTGSVVSDAQRTTTMLALDNGRELLLIDCGGDAVQRMKIAGLDVTRLRRLFLTHEHADHCSGFPLLLERLWVEGLRGQFHVHGIASALDQARRIHDAFNTADWPGYPEIVWHEVSGEQGSTVLESESWHLRATECRHPVPCIGANVLDKLSGSSLHYSADTEPHEMQAKATLGIPLIVHEATGDFPGHSSAVQAAELAAQVGAERLVLVHVPPQSDARDGDLTAARQVFGRTELALEGGSIEF